MVAFVLAGRGETERERDTHTQRERERGGGGDDGSLAEVGPGNYPRRGGNGVLFYPGISM